MKKRLISITFGIMLILSALVPFAPRAVSASATIPLCMVDYGTDDVATIQAANPAILIDNTAHGYWGGNSNPANYPNTHEFSYITGGYEGTEYVSNGVPTTEDSLAANLTRIDGIASDGAWGVFLDEVSSYPTTAGKSYLSSIYARCQADNLKLAINCGDNEFDWNFLTGVCDYIMTNEQYNGGSPSTSEIGIGLSRCFVANDNCSSSANAISYTETAWNDGYGYAWCTNSTSYDLPSYLSTYISGITGYSIVTENPTVSTSAATNKLSTSATINGNLSNLGSAD